MTKFFTLLSLLMVAVFYNGFSQTTLAAGDVALIGYNTTGAPDNLALLILKDLSAGTVFYVSDNEIASAGGTTFTDLNEGEASFTVKAGQTISAGTVVVLPWGAAAVSTTTYDFSATTGAGLGNNNEEIYIYTAPAITSTTPTAFIYFLKVGTSSSAIPAGLTAGTNANAISGATSRYKTTGATYTGTPAQLLTAIGTASNWEAFAPSMPTDWSFAVTVSNLPTVNLSVSTNAGTEAAQTVVTVTATTSAAVTADETVTLAVTGANILSTDYALSNTTITIPTGSTMGTVTFTIADDMDAENLETATLTISSPSAGITLGATKTQNITIADNDFVAPTVNLAVSTNTATEENATTVTVTATASAAVLGNQTVNLAITGAGITNFDYSLQNTVITILNGETTGTTTFKIKNDVETEGIETALLAISAPSLGIVLGATITQAIAITDNGCQLFMRKSTATSTAGAEISAFDFASKRIYTVAGTAMEYYTLSNTGLLTGPTNMPYGFTAAAGLTILPNSVAINNGIVAVAYAIVDANNAQQLGIVAFYNAATASYLSNVTVGYLPDMVCFSPDGTKVLTANEGEPNSYGQATSFDPEGSVSIIDIASGIATATVTNANFTSFNSQMAVLKAAGVRIYGPSATVAQDLEPEYIAFSADGTKAIITLQENNAVAELDMATATITQVLPLGLKDHNIAGNSLDASDRDLAPAYTAGTINIQNWPVKGMYQPDAIASFNVAGIQYYITANEGDARSYTGFNEEVRGSATSYVLDPTIFPNAATLKLNQNLGRLNFSNATGNTDVDTDFEELHAFGARSFTIWNSSFAKIYDSGNEIEQITATQNPTNFNSDGTAASLDSRSDNKGPEPEATTTGVVNGIMYAFIGSERTGDILVYDITNPAAPVFKQYIDNPTDLQVEGLLFIPANQSPTGKALIIASAEVSRTVSVYEFSLIGSNIAPITDSTFTGIQGATTDYGNCSGLLATVKQSGTNPINGNVKGRVWVDAATPLYYGSPFVQRHYEITPSTNATTATATVTLYFKQTEFDDFNAHPNSALDLPTSPTDVVGISNLIVAKYAGVATKGTGYPDNYTGAPTLINPDDAKIIFNTTTQLWEVSFDVVGFSGFIVQTQTTALSINNLTFNANAAGSNAVLNWKTITRNNINYYEVLYSTNGVDFVFLNKQNAQTGNGEKTYNLLHNNAINIANKLFYKIKIVNNNGEVTFSNPVEVYFNEQYSVSVYPNPASNILQVKTNITNSKPLTVSILNTKGQIVGTKIINTPANFLLPVSHFSKGIYVLQLTQTNEDMKVLKFIKQ